MTPDLTDDDKAILAELLRETIGRSRFLLSPRVQSYRAILAKLARPFATGAASATQAARRAQHGADEEAAEISPGPKALANMTGRRLQPRRHNR